MSICSGIVPILKSNLTEILSLRQKKKLKKDNSYVTEGDLFVESLILDYFSSLEYSNLVISEEQYMGEKIDLNSSEYIFVVDPIDGTENYTSGLKEWGVGISVYKEGKHFESMIALPELDQYLFTGQKVQKYNSRIYGLSSSLSKEDLLKIEPGFEYRIIGCSMYNMYNVIVGAYKLYQNPKGAMSWDILPGLNLAIEHNLDVKVENKKYNGEFLQPNRKYRFTIKNK